MHERHTKQAVDDDHVPVLALKPNDLSSHLVHHVQQIGV